jgi:hypothetical protein
MASSERASRTGLFSRYLKSAGPTLMPTVITCRKMLSVMPEMMSDGRFMPERR